MSRGSKVLKTTAIYFVGNFASKLLTFFLLPIYTVYLTSTDFGQVDLLLSTLPLIAPIFTFQVTESIFRFLCNSDKDEDRKRVITTSLLIFFIGIVVFILLYIPIIINFELPYAMLFIVYFFVTYFGIFMQQVLRGLQKTVEYAITGVVATIVQATLNIVLIVKFGMGGESLLIASIGASTVISMIIICRTKIWKFIRLDLLSKEEIKRQLKYGIPLIPNQISWWVIGLMGKYILLYFHGSNENGLLAVASKFPGLVATISSIFFLAWTENIIREFEADDRDEYFTKGLNLFIRFTFTTTACMLPVIKMYNVLTISGEFSEVWKYIPLLMIGSVFNSLAAFLGTVYTASMKTKGALTTTIIAGIVSIILSLIMIPLMSIWGVIIVNAITFFIFFVVRIKSVKKIIKFKLELSKTIPSILLLVVSIVLYYCLGVGLQVGVLVCLGVCTILINREIIMEILKTMGINIKFKKGVMTK